MVVLNDVVYDSISAQDIGVFTILDKINLFHQNKGDSLYVKSSSQAICYIDVNDLHTRDTIFLNLSPSYMYPGDTSRIDTFRIHGECGLHYLNIKNGMNEGMSISEIRDLIFGLTSIESRNRPLNLVKSFPNPTRDIIILESYTANINRAIVCNSMGAIIFDEHNFAKKEIEFDLRNQPSGIYIILLEINGRFNITRIVKK